VLKAAFDVLGMPLGGVRAPLIDVDAHGRAQVEATLRQAGKL
jgi:dihydrodipicolinate synthase/N-acetylneuraminate lyase